MASSSALMMTRLSMPLSFAIWSISRFKASMLAPPSAGPSGSAPGFFARSFAKSVRVKRYTLVAFPISSNGTSYCRPSTDRLAIPASNRSSLPRKRRRPSSGRRVSIDTSAPQAAAKSFAAQPAVESRRRHLEPVAHRNRVRRVELRTDLPRYLCTVLDRHQTVTGRCVDHDPKLPGPRPRIKSATTSSRRAPR